MTGHDPDTPAYIVCSRVMPDGGYGGIELRLLQYFHFMPKPCLDTISDVSATDSSFTDRKA
jgi:glycyl-tRNA synthetase alpha subunit